MSSNQRARGRGWQPQPACTNVHRTVPRLGLIFAAVLLAASFAARPAAAQTGGTGVITGAGGGTGTQLAPEDIFIGVQHEKGANLSDFDVARFFNKANCDCDEQVFLYFALNPSGVAKRTQIPKTGNVQFWVGSLCDNPLVRGNQCKSLLQVPTATFLNVGNQTIMTTARVLSNESSQTLAFPDTGNPTCTSVQQQFSQYIYALVDTSGDGYPETTASRSVTIDLTAPPSPDSNGITVEGGDEALVINWPKVDQSIYTDLRGYQVLCNRGGSLQVFNDGTFDPGFNTCPSATSSVDGGVENLNTSFICSPLLTASATSFRIKILQNDIVYGAAVVSVDNSFNASTPDIFYGAPVATKSFYEVYRNGHEGAMEPGGNVPGSAAGGFCAVAEPAPPRRTLWLTGLELTVAGLIVVARRRGRS